MDAVNDAGVAGEVLEWAAIGRPIAGSIVSGDLHLVAAFPGGVLLAVVDGLGHGEQAEMAARAALDTLRQQPGLPITTLVTRCHRQLDRLRGAVMSLASIDASQETITWIGVGNVEGVLVRISPSDGQPSRERLLLWGGIVGQTLPTLRAATLALRSGDTLVLATDGVRSAFLDDLNTADGVEEIARRVFAKHVTGADDALVVVARYRGVPS
jgi:phosphoserine phosphatase RsbX